MVLSDGQEQALVELRLIADRGSDFELVRWRESSAGSLDVDVTISMAGIQRAVDGVPLRQREPFTFSIAPGFPFAVPTVATPHWRWMSWPHVQWGCQVCLFESPETQWDASDGMFGLVERLLSWLERAAVNQLDETGEPLHPPVTYVTNWSTPVVVPRIDTPDVGDEPWMGLVSLDYATDQRVDIVGWSTFDSFVQVPGQRVGVAVLLATDLTFEFPLRVGDLLAALAGRGAERRSLLLLLGFAALQNPLDEPVYMVVGAPMRGERGGTRRQHLAVWRLEKSVATRLWRALGRFTNVARFQEQGNEIAETVDAWSQSEEPVEWCRVDEARSEVTRRRDTGSPLQWFRGRKVSIWGCGAIGAQVAEILTRAGVGELVLRDRSTVKHGILVRQPFADADIGRPKAKALADRLLAVRPETRVEAVVGDIVSGPLEGRDWPHEADLIIDATASETVAKKLERVRRDQPGAVPPIASMSFGRDASRGLLTVAMPKYTGGTRDLIRKSRIKICSRPEWAVVAEDFWGSEDVDLFYPEPGCSAPTFTGSYAQVLQLVGAMASALGSELADGEHPGGSSHFFGVSGVTPARSTLDFRHVPDTTLAEPASGYEVRISPSAREDLRAWIRRSRRVAGPRTETGGHLFGERDSASQVVWIDEITGPPPDSQAAPDGFVCGTVGVSEVTEAKRTISCGATRYIGMWHSHPQGDPVPSPKDHKTMQDLVAGTDPRPTQQHELLLIVGGDLEANSRMSAVQYSREQPRSLKTVQRDATRCQQRTSLAPLTPRNRDIALALSGGGSRAVAFHLGCLRALHDRGLLDRVNLISAASGGALLAALYAYSAVGFDEFDARVLELLRRGITPRVVWGALFSRRAVQALATGMTAGVVALGALGLRSIAGILGMTGLLSSTRRRSFDRLGPVLPRTYSRTSAFADVLRSELGSVRLSDLPRAELDVIINATELRTGTAFRFGNRESGSWRLGYVQGNDIEVAEAVAASAAYPTLLPAIDRHFELVGRDGKVRRERVALSDGGIYDNLATSALDPDRDPGISFNVFSSRIVVSCDAGQGEGLIRPPYLWPERVAAAASTTHRRSQNSARSKLFALERTGELDAFVTAFLGMSDSRIPYAPSDLIPRDSAVSYPTDFSPMKEEDIEMLSTRGEQIMGRLAAYYLRT